VKKILEGAVVFALGVAVGSQFHFPSPNLNAGGAQPSCVFQNGDVNGDRNIDLSDAISVVNHLFDGTLPVLLPLCDLSAVEKGLPDTGQTLCYDRNGISNNCGGDDASTQDAVFDTGCPMEDRFIANQNGTVLDRCTGLLWQRESGFQGFTLNWFEALEYCENLQFAGFDDWRLPNVRELQSIVNYGRIWPATTEEFSLVSTFYWSSTTLSDDPGVAWVVNLFDGLVSYGIKSSRKTPMVVAVRGGPGG